MIQFTIEEINDVLKQKQHLIQLKAAFEIETVGNIL